MKLIGPRCPHIGQNSEIWTYRLTSADQICFKVSMNVMQPSSLFQEKRSSADSSLARTLAKGLTVLECFGPGTSTLGNAEIAVRTGLPRTTVARLTKTLAELGYLAYEPHGAKYRLWGGMLKLAYPLLAEMTLRQIARPAMQDFADSVRGTVSLGIRYGRDMIYVETARSTDNLHHTPDIGSSIPLPRAAMGRALWALLDDKQSFALRRQFEREDPEIWARYGSAVEQARRSCAERGFCLSFGDWFPQIHAAAVPLFTDPTTGFAFAVNCGLPAYRLAAGQLEAEIGPRLAALASNIRMLAKQGRDMVP